MFFSKDKNEVENEVKESNMTTLNICFKNMGLNDVYIDGSLYYDDLSKFDLDYFLDEQINSNKNLYISKVFFDNYSTRYGNKNYLIEINKKQITSINKFRDFFKNNFYDFLTYLIFFAKNKTYGYNTTNSIRYKYEFPNSNSNATFDFGITKKDVVLKEFYEKCLDFENKINYFMQKFDLTFKDEKTFNLDDLFLFYKEDDFKKMSNLDNFDETIFYKNVEKNVNEKLKYSFDDLFEFLIQLTLANQNLNNQNLEDVLNEFNFHSFSDIQFDADKNDVFLINDNNFFENPNQEPDLLNNHKQRLLDSINQIKQ